MFYKLMLVTQKGTIPIPKYLDFIKQCADSGITSVQLREKNASNEEQLYFGEALFTVLQSYNIPLIINDSPALAKELGISYIHVGQSDEKVEEILSSIPNAIIGLSIEQIEELHRANTQKLAYISASAIFSTPHKDNLKTIWGLHGLAKLKSLTQHPLIAIGGINLDNLESVIEHGAEGVALIGALHNSSNPSIVARKCRDIIDRYDK